MQNVAHWMVAGILATSLAGCESSSRLGSILPGSRNVATASPITPLQPAPLAAAPTGEVESSTLPDPGGLRQSAALPAPTALPAPAASPSGLNSQNVSGLNPSAPVAPRPASRSSATGAWSVTEASGGKCKMTLSSAPKLDLYGAATSGCQTKELQRVNAWELSGSEVVLYEPGGGVVARLQQSGGGFSGTTARSGAAVSLSK